MFAQKDLEQIQQKNQSPEGVLEQIKLFEKGIDFVQLVRPATQGDGIERISEEETNHYLELFDNNHSLNEPGKFVPASGAATRMFKSLFDLLTKLTEKPANFPLDEDQERFFSDLDDYPFYPDLTEMATKKGVSLDELREKKDHAAILRLLLLPDGLNYGNLPKGLLPFHSYPKEIRTAFEEHFAEASRIFKEGDKIHMHFTISEEHHNLFSNLKEEMIKKYRLELNREFDVSFSFQSPSTDTIAVNPDNTPFRLKDGRLLFRPGGHGALLKNLSEVDRKILFIGNIDNVSPDRNSVLRVRYKKLLGGFLLEKVDFIHTALQKLAKGDRSEVLKKSLVEFISEISPEYADSLKKVTNDRFNELAFDFLDKPIRVCGMVKNEGEPGGGPFWVRSSDGQISKQIIESSQIDLENPEQEQIFKSSTHFNPVDIAVCIKSYKNAVFNLEEFRDPSMAFISHKSQGGQNLKALELPGLWNGSMAYWLTWFVEVPVETFTPVKTVFDLNRPQHQKGF